MQYHAKVLKKVTTLRVMIILSTVQNKSSWFINSTKRSQHDYSTA